VAGSEALPSFTAAQAAQEKQFAEDFKVASPDFQTEHGYPSAPYTDEVLTMGSPHITHAFGCLSLTLELPFKDNANDPDEHTGWDGARSARLGAAVLQPMLKAIRS
jgi:murein tripeptide amidase MpaA